MRFSDAHGDQVTAASGEAVAALDRTVAAYLGFRNDTGDRLKEALNADPDCAMAHCLRGYFMMLFGTRAMVPRARRSLDAARQAASSGGVSEREAAHLAALAVWVAGDFADATSRWEALAIAHPRDLLALKLAQYGCFYAGESGRTHRIVTGALPHWEAGLPGYGFLLGCHAFGLEETGDYAAAERAGREAVARNPADIWAAHAVSHVFEMSGRAREGVGWIDSLEAEWRDCNNFSYHALWHRCLFLLELGACDRVLDLYDREVRPASTDDLLDISNAASLLWRLEQRGVAVGERWEELASCAEAHRDDHLLIFGDVHYLMALEAAGRSEDAEALRDSLARFAGDSGESQAAVARAPGLALADGVLRHRRGDYGAAFDAIIAVRDAIWRIGGSHAQRDLFEEMLVDAAQRAGRHEAAASLLAERVAKRPRNAWGWRSYAEAFDRLGDSAAAERARLEAARAMSVA